MEIASKNAAVKTKAANGRGLCDLSRNMWELAWDWYQENYEALPPTDPVGPTTKPPPESLVIRGGSWFLTATNARVGKLISYEPTPRNISLGFRSVRSYP